MHHEVGEAASIKGGPPRAKLILIFTAKKSEKER
jgi:hypothetical protein